VQDVAAADAQDASLDGKDRARPNLHCDEVVSASSYTRLTMCWREDFGMTR
jgi:hypothetical protein